MKGGQEGETGVAKIKKAKRNGKSLERDVSRRKKEQTQQFGRTEKKCGRTPSIWKFGG